MREHDTAAPSQQPPAQPAGHAAPSASPRLQPRPVRSSHDAARIRRQNRRLEYLRRHPTYLTSSEREFANVTLYNKLVRSFQTPAERMTEAREKGFGQVLEASILRNPEPLARNIDDVEEEEEEEEDTKMEDAHRHHCDGQRGRSGAASTLNNTDDDTDEDEDEDEDEDDSDDDDDDDDDDLRLRFFSGHDPFGAADALWGASASPHEAAHEAAREAARLWLAFVSDWFVRGGAADVDGFDYDDVDDDSELDALERADAEAAWFDEESAGWASDGDGDGDGDGRDDEGGEKRTKERVLQGETGIQDF